MRIGVELIEFRFRSGIEISHRLIRLRVEAVDGSLPVRVERGDCGVTAIHHILNLTVAMIDEIVPFLQRIRVGAVTSFQHAFVNDGVESPRAYDFILRSTAGTGGLLHFDSHGGMRAGEVREGGTRDGNAETPRVFTGRA